MSGVKLKIRGHGRTYADNTRKIINGLKEAQTKNPVFLLDEIDKMAADYKGSPSSAMLEVLSPEQNKTFVDHYLEVPFDLSKILFVTTANSLSTIPGQLLDRMEVIEVSGYIEEEKLNIAQKYLLPKTSQRKWIRRRSIVTVEEQAMRDIINYYTREAGVRTLERTIGKVCRKIAKKFVENPSLEGVVVTSKDLEEYLGRDKYLYDLAGTKPEIGVSYRPCMDFSWRSYTSCRSKCIKRKRTSCFNGVYLVNVMKDLLSRNIFI